MASANSGASSWAGIRSPVAWTLLGLVIERPGYGYSLLKRFEREYAELLPIRSDWHVYRALDALKSKGLIDQIPDQGGDALSGGRQPKPHYRATDAGVTVYAEWLLSQVGTPHKHAQLLARQLAVLAHRPEVALQIIDRYEAICLEALARVATPDRHRTTAEGNTLASRLAGEESRLALAAVLPWLEYARAEFRSLQAAKEHGLAPA